jgi:hypothetical protein
MRVRMLIAAVASVLWIGCGSNSGGTGGTAGHAGTGGHSGSAGSGGTGGMAGDGGVATCDPAAQTGCTDSANPKCSVTFPDPQGGGVIACEPAGTVAPGGACTRVTDSGGNELAGVDNCTNGYCTAFGATTGRQCSRYCDTPTQATNCTSNQKCFQQAPPYGLCRKTCDPFGAQSQCPQTNSLAASQACSWSVLIDESGSGAFCTVIGATVADGAACNPNNNPPMDCVQGDVCLGDNVCHKLCDASGAHNCPTGQMCNPATFLTSNTCDASGNGCPAPEMCDMTSMQCFLVAPGPMMGGWCIAMPDGGGANVAAIARPLKWNKDLKGNNR